MNENEMRELDAWIAEHVMGWIKTTDLQRVLQGLFYVEPFGSVMIPVGDSRTWITDFTPTTRPADAYEVLKKCAEHIDTIGGGPIEIDFGFGHEAWRISAKKTHSPKSTVSFAAATLECAIANFAKQLFGQQIPHNESPAIDCDAIPRTSHT